MATVEGAPAAVGYPVPLPSTAAANDHNLTHVWVRSSPETPREDGRVALVFDEGKVDVLMHRVSYERAVQYFQAFIAEREREKSGGVSAEIGQVSASPALIVWPGSNDTYSNPGVIIFWRDGIAISVYGNSEAYGVDTLLGVAESMH